MAGTHVSLAELEEALDILSEVVSVHGGQYLKLFSRLHKEYQERIQEDDMMNVAVSWQHKRSNFGTHFGTQKGTHGEARSNFK